MKHHFFKRFEYEFEATRLLWYAPYGGADYAEVASVCEKIRHENDYEWHRAWENFAQQLVERARIFSSPISKGQALLRASRYYQAAEFFLAPTDPKKLQCYTASTSFFYQGLEELGIEYTIHLVNYQRVPARTVFLKPKTTHIRGTFFICGGFDALLEELYFTSAQMALRAGYQVILFEGPGQSDLIRKHQRYFTADWELICQAVIDFYEERQLIIGPKIGLGLSLGGLLLTCAAIAQPQLFDKLILHNYFPTLLDSFKINIPTFLHPLVERGFHPFLEIFVSFYIRTQHFLNWQIEHAKWTFGAKTLNELLEKCRPFSDKLAIGTLKTDCLVLLAKNDNYYNYQLGLDFFKTIEADKKRLILFDKELFSSDLHCQNGSAFDSNDQILQWLDESLY